MSDNHDIPQYDRVIALLHTVGRNIEEPCGLDCYNFHCKMNPKSVDDGFLMQPAFELVTLKQSPTPQGESRDITGLRCFQFVPTKETD